MASLKRQLRKVLASKVSYGQSKHTGNRDGSANQKIYSSSTFKTYQKVGNRYISFIKNADPSCHSLQSAYDRGLARMFVEEMIEQQKSPYTIAQARSALAKIHNKTGIEICPSIPVRHSKDIFRSREVVARDLRMQETLKDLYSCARNCGLRRRELENLRAKDIIVRPDDTISIYVRNGKGGRLRTVDCLPGCEQLWKQLKEKTLSDQHVFPESRNTSLHRCRAEYARAMYDKLKQPLDDLRGKRIHVTDPKAGRSYHFPAIYKTKDGREYDREALIQTSAQLGHGCTRSDTIVNHYLWTH